MTYLMDNSGRAATLAVAATFALLTLAACGGGGGGGPVATGETDARPPTGTTTDMAEIAALSVPNSGGSSVTHSSNARNGRTTDSVSTTVEHDGSEYSYRLRNGSRWSISDDDTVENRISGTLLGQSFNGVELRKDLAGGTLWAEIYTTREAPTPTTGAGQPVRLEDLPDGSRVEGMTQAEWNARMGDGSLDGVAGTFSCDRAGGGSCPSFGGTHFDPTGTDWIFTPAGTTSSPDTDYLNLGLWVYVPNGVTDLLGWEYGVFADGSDPFDSGSIRGVTGPARYRGAAAGVFIEQGEPEEVYWTAETVLTADFGTAGELGTISGNVRTFMEGGVPVDGGLTVSLNSAPIGNSNNGFFTGSAGYTYRGATVRDGGKWGGRFFGNGEADGRPGSVAGTFGVTNGTGVSLLGAFVTEK